VAGDRVEGAVEFLPLMRVPLVVAHDAVARGSLGPSPALRTFYCKRWAGRHTSLLLFSSETHRLRSCSFPSKVLGMAVCFARICVLRAVSERACRLHSWRFAPEMPSFMPRKRMADRHRWIGSFSLLLSPVRWHRLVCPYRGKRQAPTGILWRRLQCGGFRTQWLSVIFNRRAVSIFSKACSGVCGIL